MTEWNSYHIKNQRLKFLKRRSAGEAEGSNTIHPVLLQKPSRTAFADAGAPLLRYRTREASRALLLPSDRSGLAARSSDLPDAANPRMAGPLSRLLLIG